ncbi:MAG: hypothetical protein OEL76_18635 [Siculibacillus sp.]|nr:hypothetical protein [Siculibacillus sp.]
MAAAVAFSRRVPRTLDDRGARRLLHAVGAETFGDGMALAAVRGRIGADVVVAHRDLPARWIPPRSPVGGRDLVRFGLGGGPRVGRLLAEAEAEWVESDFTLDREALLAFLARRIEE